jgi:hypothetical protein
VCCRCPEQAVAGAGSQPASQPASQPPHPATHLDLLGPGGAPQQGLPVGADLAHDLADLGLEAHVKHAVCLIQHQVGDAAQVGGAGLEEVDEAPRGGNHNLHAAAQVAAAGTGGKRGGSIVYKVHSLVGG